MEGAKALEQTGKTDMNKKTTYTATIGKEGDWWIGWIEEVPGVNCQEASREELLDSLTITLREMLEIEPAKSRGENFERELITI